MKIYRIIPECKILKLTFHSKEFNLGDHVEKFQGNDSWTKMEYVFSVLGFFAE